MYENDLLTVINITIRTGGYIRAQLVMWPVDLFQLLVWPFVRKERFPDPDL